MKLIIIGLLFASISGCSTSLMTSSANTISDQRNPASEHLTSSVFKGTVFFCKQNELSCIPMIDISGKRMPITGVDGKLTSALVAISDDYAFNNMTQTPECQVRGFIRENRFYVVEGGLDQMPVPH